MSQLPTIKQLRYFVMLERLGHFGRAAEACFVSQSAFSVAIKELESMLGSHLVDRTNKQVTVTETGREVAAKARQVIDDIEELVALAQGHTAPLAGKLKLGVIPTVAPFLIPRILTPLRESYPDLQLYLVEDLSNRLYNKLMDGEIDLILMAFPYEMRSVDYMNLFEDKFYLAYNRHTKLIDPSKYDFEALDGDSILLLEDGHCLRDHAIAACKLRDMEKVTRFSASSLFTLIQMVDEDLGITYLPEMALDSPLMAQTQIETKPLADESFRDIGLAWRRGSGRVADFRLLGKFIRQHTGKMAETAR